MRIVIDTNVIVSALLVTPSLPAKILDYVLTGKLTIAYDNRMLSEYVDVLFKEKLKIDKTSARYVIDFIVKEGDIIISMPEKINFTDKSDKKFYEVYKSGKASYLITGNKKHFPKDTGIVTPREFLEKTKIY